jgi:hypothetical protein
MATWTRRRILQAAGAPFVAGPALAQVGDGTSLPPLPRVGGAINLQPARRLDPAPGDPGLDLAVIEAQLRLVYELGFGAVRISAPFQRFGPDFRAAIAYVRALRALGIDVLVVLTDFAGFDLVQALSEPRTRDGVLDAHLAMLAGPVAPASARVRPGAIAFQVLNEPTHFLGLSPREYVSDFLAPVYARLRSVRPDVPVVAAAEVGNADGLPRVRAMLEAGAERSCDVIAYHVYSERLIPLLAGLTPKPVLVTESGVRGPQNHLAWVEDVFPAIAAGIAGVGDIYFYLLFDLEPRAFRLVSLERTSAGVQARAESEALVSRRQQRVAAAAAGAPHASFASLVPDVGLYLPTADDLRLLAAVPLP